MHQRPLLLRPRREELPGGDLLRPVETVFLQVFLSVLHGGAVAILLEQPVEIRQVVEAGLDADLGDSVIRIEQELARVADPEITQKAREAAKGEFLKEMTECRFRHIDLGGNVANFQVGCGEVLQNVLIGHLDPAVRGVPGLWGKSLTGEKSGFLGIG